MELFGFSIKRKNEEDEKSKVDSFVPKQEDDGAVQVTAAGGAYGTYIDMDGSSNDEAQLVTKYRQMENHPEVKRALDDIINEAVVVGDDRKVVEINLDQIEISDRIKKTITEEFDRILELLDFSNEAYDIFNRFYVDGRLRYHVIIDEENTRKGITELRYIDPRKIKKIREVELVNDPKTGAEITKTKNEYYVYNERGFLKQAQRGSSDAMMHPSASIKGVKIASDSIAETTSGIMNETNTLVLSYLHQAIKPANQLNMLEDSSVIYRLARAPERRIFYIDVGNLPKAQAEQYLKDMMTRHKNRLVYDSQTGEMRNDKKHMTMLEDFWLPRREGGRGTEITTLPGGDNLGEMEDILYFQRNLYKALRVPMTRMETETAFNLGRGSEITRDEIKFAKFITRARIRFSIIFDVLLGKQLVLKNIMSPEDWEDIKNKVMYDFRQDNHFQEMKEIELLGERLARLRDMEDLVGVYFSREYVNKNVLRFSDEEIKEMKKQMDAEEKSGEYDDEDMEDDLSDKSPDTSSDPESSKTIEISLKDSEAKNTKEI